MRNLSFLREVTALILGLALLGLAACGQEQAAQPGGEDGLDAEAPSESAANETPEEAEDAGEAAMAETPGDVADTDLAEAGESATDGIVPDPTSAMSFDADHEGEDLYQRGFYAEAMDRWREDAEAGDSYAAYRLGTEYFDGQIVERDLETAARYQRLASDLGNPAAMFELASFYEDGIGVEPNVSEAAAWYLEAARRGYPPAQHNIATMYEDGAGVEQDLVQAYVFYSLAIEQGFRVNFERNEGTGTSVFVDPRVELRGRMSDEQFAEAQAALADFTPTE